MTSKAVASFHVKGLGAKNTTSDVAIATTLKKQVDDATLSFTFTDASLKDLKGGQGVVIGAEKKVGDGIKAALAYDLGRKDTIATLTVDRNISGNDLSLKAIYKTQGDMFILEESWKFDSHNKLSGTYNFRNEAATFTYTYAQGPWTAEGKYDFARDAPILSIKKKEGKHTLQAVYGIKDESAVLSWEQAPLKVALSAKAGKSGVRGLAATITATHEFDL